MAKLFFFFTLGCLALIEKGTCECESGWTAYKDDVCLQASTDLFTYDEAQSYCASKSDGVNAASLVMVKEFDLQEVLSNYTKDYFENLWLGANYDPESAQFKWYDGESLSYTNWAEGYPRNITGAEVCIQLSPPNAKMTADLEGNWQDAICQRRNLALCQRQMPWSFQDAVKEIKSLRKELLATKQILEATNDELKTVNSRVVPVGSIYVEYHNQPNPTNLWPALAWEDITGSYAGQFFRALGGGSDGWGAIQQECSPRLTEVNYAYDPRSSPGPPGNVQIPTNGWSSYILAGGFGSYDNWEKLRFHMQSCEVRPKNQAVRIWKRIA